MKPTMLLSFFVIAFLMLSCKNDQNPEVIAEETGTWNLIFEDDFDTDLSL